MKKLGLMVSLTLALSLIIAACSGGQNNSQTATPSTSAEGAVTTESAGVTGTETTSTGLSATVAPATTEAPLATSTTEAMTTVAPVATTEAPMTTAETPMATVSPMVTSTTTAGGVAIPNTGSTGADRLSHMLQYPVIGQSGQEVARVGDIALNLGTGMVDYVIVRAGPSLKLGDVYIPVPWSAVTVRQYEGMAGAQTTMMATSVVTSVATMKSTPMATAGAAMATTNRNLAFYLNVSDDTLRNAPNFSGIPEVSASSWDAKMSSYWSQAGTGGVAGATSTVMTTTTATPAATLAAGVTATAGAPSASAKGMKGHILASALLTYRLNDSASANAGKVSDALIDLASGRIMYLIVSGGANLGLGNKVALVPLQAFRNNVGGLTLLVPTSVLAKAPLFPINELPDFSTTGWDTQLNSYWQSNLGMK